MGELKKNEKSNGILFIKYFVPVIVALLIFLGIKVASYTYRMKVIDINKYEKLVSGEKQSMIFVTSNECSTCVTTKDLLRKMLQGSNIKTYEINFDNLNDDEKERLMNIFVETKEGVTAPGLLIVKENTLISSFYGPFDEDLIIEFLQNNNLVKKIGSDSNE